jgi:hypothetical protein
LASNELSLRDVVADTGYSNGFNYAFLEHRGISPWIPTFGAYKPEVDGFTYQAQANEYRCRTDKPLPFRKYRATADGTWRKHYRAYYQDCQACPFKKDCVPSADHKQLVRSAFDAAYRRAWHRQRSSRGQQMRQVRQRTVDPYLAICCSITACGGSVRKEKRLRIRPCCSAQLPTTSRSCSSTDPPGSCASRSPSSPPGDS